MDERLKRLERISWLVLAIVVTTTVVGVIDSRKPPAVKYPQSESVSTHAIGIEK